LIAASPETTVPPPLPVLVTVKAPVVRVNVASTLCARSTVTTHAPVPAQAPAQPANIEVPSGVAERVTTCPPSKAYEHVGPQLIPDGDDVTVPPPLPAIVTVTGYVNRAFTDFAALIVTAHVGDVPEHAPVQPANVAPASLVAVRVTDAPASKVAAQMAPQ
jgi:hypothetical protein